MRMQNTLGALICAIAVSACQSSPPPETPAAQQRVDRTMATIADCVAASCARLNIDRGALPDFSILQDLPHVTALRMSWTDFETLEDIAAMNQLRELHISSTAVRDLSGLAEFPDLTMLHVQWNRNIDDFSPIGQITTLTELALGGNNVGDMAFVADLVNLDGLSLVNGTVTSFDALRNHPALMRLDLAATNLPDDISALLTIDTLAQVSVRRGMLNAAQTTVLDQLEARGVEVDNLPDIVVVIC